MNSLLPVLQLGSISFFAFYLGWSVCKVYETQWIRIFVLITGMIALLFLFQGIHFN